MQGIKSAKIEIAKIEIANLALLIPCMEFDFFLSKYLHLKSFECAII
jgi:hypothetical protein